VRSEWQSGSKGVKAPFACLLVMLSLIVVGCFLNPNYQMLTDRQKSVRLILDSAEVQHLISQQESFSSRERQEIVRYGQDIERLAPECMRPGETCPRLEESERNREHYIPERVAFLDAMATKPCVLVPPNSYCRVVQRSAAKCTKNPQYSSAFVKVRVSTGPSKGTEGWGCEEDIFHAWPMP